VLKTYYDGIASKYIVEKRFYAAIVIKYSAYKKPFYGIVEFNIA